MPAREPIADRLLRILTLAGTGALLVAVGLTMTDIALRSPKLGTVVGIVDMVQLCVMVSAMLAIPYGFLADQHVSIDLFTRKMPDPVQRGLQIFAAILATVFLAAVFWFSLQQALTEHAYGDKSQTIGIRMIWYWVPFLIGIGLSVLANLIVVARLWSGRVAAAGPHGL
jgi:TRAP-type C4-dicarboxylate transport system permease small subunit